jgi:hypothetical protein
MIIHALALLISTLGAGPLAAQHAMPSKPFLERTGFLMESAGFRARLANDDQSRKALIALPPHKFVVHGIGADARYIYADPGHCNCIFTGTRDNYPSYRDMLANPRPGVDYVAPDFKTQASALLGADPERGQVFDDPSMDLYFRGLR